VAKTSPKRSTKWAVAIELRNDIGTNSLNDIETAREVRGVELEVQSVMTLYPFNICSAELALRAETLARRRCDWRHGAHVPGQ
jgi:predicted xylose isomerase-like sugar epimerase